MKRRKTFRASTALAAGAVAFILWLPLWVGLDDARNAEFINNLEFYGDMMGSLTTLIFPLLVVLLSCLGVNSSLAFRYVANTRTRRNVRAHLGRTLARTAGFAGSVFFVQSLLPAIFAFGIWPLLGSPNIDFSGSGLTPEQAVADSYTSFAYGTFLHAGPLWFALGYSTFVGLAAAAYAALAVCLLVTIPNRILALALPFLRYAATDIGFALAGTPQLSLRFSIFPFGLSTNDPLIAAAPTLTLVAAVTAFVAYVIHHAPTNPRLT